MDLIQSPLEYRQHTSQEMGNMLIFIQKYKNLQVAQVALNTKVVTSPYLIPGCNEEPEDDTQMTLAQKKDM